MAIIDDLRNQIEQIDSKIYSTILPLLEQRTIVSEKIADYKREHNLPIFDKKREDYLLSKSKHPELCQFLMDCSKNTQKKRLTKKN